MKMNKLVTYINRGLAAFTVSLSTFLVFCVVWQVLSRYVLGKPSTVTDELARYLFMWVALIGAAYTTGLKRHLAIDLLTIKLKGKKKLVNEIVIQVAIALFSYVVLVHGGTQLALKTLATGQLTPALGLEMGYIYFCLPISGALMIFYSVIFAYERVKQLMSGETLVTDSQLDS
ncbi:TPA: TRAP transporter small permease subunit [Vibrio vulnificus]|nr:TRAP transporter small permease subunit [Vibrio vulnificus]HAS6091248.1 TRAP transporter small permease subunit [Vibrio vulnificus]HAS6408945.1 TRAP transporter small permease subunit [Vibrio vulnificus]HAS6413878.1 TRAP transporter small permease subunit [Vibrio vulnificus]